MPGQKEDRRFVQRFMSKSFATILRTSDVMRLGIDGELVDVSVSGVGVMLDQQLEDREPIELNLRNPVQRFEKTVRGVVCHVSQESDGRWRTGVELRTPLIPNDVSSLKVLTTGTESRWL